MGRAEVIVARDIFHHCCRKANFQVGLRDLDDHASMAIQELGIEVWQKIERVLAEISRERFDGKRHDLFSFFRKLCPLAHPKHLRMFDAWCHQFDALVEQHKVRLGFEEAVTTYLRNDRKPVIPRDELAHLEGEFLKLDRTKCGHVSLEEIEQAWGMDIETLHDLVKSNDVSEDGYVDKHDFIRLFCPPEYRPPSMSGEDRQVLGKLLLFHEARARTAVLQEEAMFSFSNADACPPIKRTPTAVLPEVAEATWERWVSLFERLDKNNDDTVDLHDLRVSGLCRWRYAT